MFDAVVSSDLSGLTIDASVDLLGNLFNASSNIGATPLTRSYSYDPLDRLKRITNSNASHARKLHVTKASAIALALLH